MGTIRKVQFKDIVDEMPKLVERHWQEVALYKDAVPLDVDWEQYLKLDKAGSLHVVGAFDHNDLVGYCIDFVIPGHIHYKSTKYAINDVIFIDLPFRGSSLGVKMLKEVERMLKEIDIKVWILHSKCHKPISKLFTRLGFKLADEQYSKVL